MHLFCGVRERRLPKDNLVQVGPATSVSACNKGRFFKIEWGRAFEDTNLHNIFVDSEREAFQLETDEGTQATYPVQLPEKTKQRFGRIS